MWTYKQRGLIKCDTERERGPTEVEKHDREGNGESQDWSSVPAAQGQNTGSEQKAG